MLRLQAVEGFILLMGIIHTIPTHFSNMHAKIG
jgi:hypothetical protein